MFEDRTSLEMCGTSPFTCGESEEQVLMTKERFTRSNGCDQFRFQFTHIVSSTCGIVHRTLDHIAGIQILLDEAEITLKSLNSSEMVE